MSKEATHISVQPVLAQPENKFANNSLLEAQPLHNGPSLTQGTKRLSSFTPSRIQPKLIIGAAKDKYEQQADDIADMVVKTDFIGGYSSTQEKLLPVLSGLRVGAMSVQRTLESPEKLEDGILQTKLISPGQADPRVKLEAGLSKLGNGSTLPAGERDQMEQKFGFDFSRVRIHNDHRSAAMAASIHARAFTIGRNIVFGRGEYMPATKQGRHLLAHELTHVVQQGQAHRNMPYQRHGTPVQPDTSRESVVRRMAWNPNTDTGQDSAPWNSLPHITGDVLNAATDAGTIVDIWLPHDGTTYWCHGYTFGGSTARGGPYSVWGRDVPTILKDDGWKRITYCNAKNNDIMIFYGFANTPSGPQVKHSGIIRSVSKTATSVNERRSTLESKWGPGSHNTSSWNANINVYGFYRIYSKTGAHGSGCGTGKNELP